MQWLLNLVNVVGSILLSAAVYKCTMVNLLEISVFSDSAVVNEFFFFLVFPLLLLLLTTTAAAITKQHNNNNNNNNNNVITYLTSRNGARGIWSTDVSKETY